MGNHSEMTTIPKNHNQSLNPPFNTFVTDCHNELQRRMGGTELEFIRTAYRINVISGIPASVFM